MCSCIMGFSAGVRAAEEVVETVSGTRGKRARQSGAGRVLCGEPMYLLVLPYSHDSGPTSEPPCLVKLEETKANVCSPPVSTTPLLGRPVLFTSGSQSHCGGYHQAIATSSFCRLLDPYRAENGRQTFIYNLCVSNWWLNVTIVVISKTLRSHWQLFYCKNLLGSI